MCVGRCGLSEMAGLLMSLAEAGPVVMILIWAGVGVAAVTFMVDGAEQVAAVGAPEQVKVRLPEKLGVRVRLHVAVEPALADCDVAPVTLNEGEEIG